MKEYCVSLGALRRGRYWTGTHILASHEETNFAETQVQEHRLGCLLSREGKPCGREGALWVWVLTELCKAISPTAPPRQRWKRSWLPARGSGAAKSKPVGIQRKGWRVASCSTYLESINPVVRSRILKRLEGEVQFEKESFSPLNTYSTS